MNIETLKKQLQEKQTLVERAYKAHQQLLGQCNLLAEQIQELQKEAKDDKKKEETEKKPEENKPEPAK